MCVCGVWGVCGGGADSQYEHSSLYSVKISMQMLQGHTHCQRQHVTTIVTSNKQLCISLSSNTTPLNMCSNENTTRS